MIYDLVRLKNALIDFYNISGMLTVLYDADFNVIVSYPGHMGALCREIRRSGELYERCVGCDRKGFAECKREGSRVIYRCHIGLTEAIAPISDGGRTLGYLMLGQVAVDSDREEIYDRIKELTFSSDADRAAVLRELRGISWVSKDRLESAVRIMEICAGYLYTGNFFIPSGSEGKTRLESYVKEHISDPSLCLEGIRQKLGLSRSALYELCKSCFGVGISDYVRICRIEKAKKMLLEGEMQVSAISRECGFSQPNHFTKTFRRMVGVLPKDYRKDRVSLIKQSQ